MNDMELILVVEGRTEQSFVREVLAPYLGGRGIYASPALIGKPGHKGGSIHFQRAQNDVGHFLKQRTDTFVSTMFDYFRIDSDWPGVADVRSLLAQGQKLPAQEKARIVEVRTHQEISKLFPQHAADRRFIPYIEMHEFEALLFSGPEQLSQGVGVSKQRIEDILARYTSPEDINEHPKNAPSKQLEDIAPGYRKVAMGTTISKGIGIPVIKAKCPHFNEWIERLEVLRNS